MKSNSWEEEFNNTIVTANAIPVNSWINGAIMGSNESDWYRFDVSVNGKVRLTFKHEYIDSNYTYWDAEFYGANNELLSKVIAVKGNITNEFVGESISLTAGTYFVRISKGFYWSNIQYAFSVDFTNSDDFSGKRDDLDISIINVPETEILPEKTERTTDDNSTDTDQKADMETGEVIQHEGIKYRITDEEEVAVTGMAVDTATLTIPAEITVDGINYEVVAVEKNAFKKNKKLKKVIISANLDYIGSNAFYACKNLDELIIEGDVDQIDSKTFYNCKKLKSISILTDSLEKIGSKAFKKIYKKSQVKLPESVYAEYSQMLKKAGLPSKAKIIY